MKLQQLSLFVENRPGSMTKICQLLQANGISICTLSLADTSEYGILRLLLKETEKAKQVLEQAGFAVNVTSVCALAVPDRAGGLADLLAILDRHNLSVEYLYAFPCRKAGQAVIVFRFEDPEAAEAALAAEPVGQPVLADLF